MAIEDEPDDDLIREMYARFGLAYYQSECLHRGLCIVLSWTGLPPRDLITRPRGEERLAQAFALTLGDVAAKLEGVLPADLAREIRTAIDTRNFLAHHFWFERAHLMFSVNNVRQLISELDGYAEMFDRLDARVSEWSEPTRQRLGLTDEVLQDSLERTLAGEADELLPDKQAVRELEKKLKRRQRLVRVWEFALEDGRRPLIFELADGSLLKLSDVGLGLTRFQEIGPGWTEHPAIKPHLPAEVAPLHHRLDDLWRLCRSLFLDLSASGVDAEEVRQTTRLIDQFCQADPTSETFRYPEDKEGYPSLSRDIELERIREVVGKISLLLDCIGTDLSVNRGDAF